MALLQQVVAIALILSLFGEGTVAQAVNYTFPQCLDHEGDPDCTQTYPQRYWERNEFYQTGGPIFLWLGGEWNAERDINGFKWADFAAFHHAHMIVLEHRFYGDSYPHWDQYNASAMGIHTVTQANADAARFIVDYKQRFPESATVPWVLFGCSYAANMVAYFKAKYPTLVNSAVASSAPLEAIYDFPGYMRVCSEVIQEKDEACATAIRGAFTCMEQVVNGSSCGTFTDMQAFPEMMGYCPIDMSDRIAREDFFSYLTMMPWAWNTPAEYVDEYCPLLKSSPGLNPLERYASFMRTYIEVPNCNRRMKNTQVLEKLRREGAQRKGIQDDDTDYTSWIWQTCNEFGYYFSSDPVHGLFGHSLFSGDIWVETCMAYWGPEINIEYVKRRVDEVNAMYGGLDIAAKCTVFVNGDWDPWSSQGIMSPDQTNDSNTVIVIDNSEHCYDVYTSITDPGVVDAQARIQAQIGTYMADQTCTM